MARKSKKMFRSPKTARRQARKRRSTIAERRKKEFLWRGLTMEELTELPLYPPEDNPEAFKEIDEPEHPEFELIDAVPGLGVPEQATGAA